MKYKHDFDILTNKDKAVTFNIMQKLQGYKVKINHSKYI